MRERRTAWVVGGSEGIGLAIAESLVRRGDHVVIASRSEAKLEAAVTTLQASRLSPDQQIAARQLDLTDAEQIASFVSAALIEFGAPHVLINTAGYARPGWLEEIPAADVRGMVELNLLGSIQLVRETLPHLTRGSRIVLTSSIAGLAGIFGYTVYSATKFGIIGFAEALRRELRPAGISVQVVCPPNTLTPGLDEESKYKPAEVLAAEENLKPVTPQHVAEDVIRALEKRQFLIVPRGSRAVARAIRYLPAVVDRALRRP